MRTFCGGIGGLLGRRAAAVVLAALLPLTVAATANAASVTQGAAPRAAVAPVMAAAAAANPFDNTMIGLVNRARAAAGVPPVTEATGLTRLSLWWSAQMNTGATAYVLKHNPNAWTMVTTYGAANRTSWGENVASSSSTATTAQELFNAYMNSAGHRANILSRNYRYIGMGTVTGAHGLFNTTEFTDAVQAGQAVVAAPVAPVAPVVADFVRDSSNGMVYRMAGGAPVFVSTWTPFGGVQPFRNITHTQLLAMPKYPANGTFVRTLGTSSAVYRIAGGAPIFVSTWAVYGAPRPTVSIDPAAVAHAGATGAWDHLRLVPLDSTFIRTPNNGAVYRIAGGAPLWVSSWTPFGGPKPYVDIDPAAVSYAGQAGRWGNLRMYPADNTYLLGIGSPKIYRVLAGKATWLTSWTIVGGPKAYVSVDLRAILEAGNNTYLSHLKK